MIMATYKHLTQQDLRDTLAVVLRRINRAKEFWPPIFQTGALKDMPQRQKVYLMAASYMRDKYLNGQ
jgi:hypothetical protein